jgi:transposase
MSARPNADPQPKDFADERTLLALIRHMGRTLDGLEQLRIQHQLRRGAFEREHGIELPPDSVADVLDAAEHAARLDIVRLWRKHPLAAWAKSYRGVGEILISRLIAEIGDPAERRTVSQLWAYCGYDPTRRRRRGMSQEDAAACGNLHAKKRCWLIAMSMLRTGNRDYYDTRREQTMKRADWTLGHKHNDALRVQAKLFLRDLWVAARASHFGPDTHERRGGAGE